jgi:hypothetical protein
LEAASRLSFVTLLCLALALPVSAATVTGQLVYQKVPATVEGLDVAHPVAAPCAQIRVQLRDSQNEETILAEGATDDAGNYRLEVPDGTAQVILYVLAQSGKIQVGNPRDNSLYVVATQPFDAANSMRITIPDQNRLSGPFNILDAIRRANRFVQQSDPTLPLADLQLTIFWNTKDAVPSPGVTHFRTNQNIAYVMGIREEDSDEFDDDVIIHEYAHYLAARFSRDDSPGGAHYLGDKQDPRLAWSEGWAHFLAKAVSGNTLFVDTMGPNGVEVFGFDIDEDVADGDVPGYWSEHSVASFLYDVFADAGTGSGHLGLGLNPIWQAMREHLSKQTFVNLIHMADALVLQDGARQPSITELLSKRQIEYRFGVIPSVPVPFPKLIQPGAAVTGSVTSLASQRINLVESADYYIFRKESDGDVRLRLKVTAPNRSSADLVLVLYNEKGVILAAVDDAHAVNSVEQLTRSVPAGSYVIGVWSFAPTSRGLRFGAAQYQLTAEF